MNNYELFDRYLRNELDGEELDLFQERLTSDSVFEKEFYSYSLLVEGIRESRRQELKAYLNERKSRGFISNPFSKNFTWLAAAIMVGFGVMYLVVSQLNPSENKEVAVNDSTRQEQSNAPSADPSTPQKESGSPEKSVEKPVVIENHVAEVAEPDSESNSSEEATPGRKVYPADVREHENNRASFEKELEGRMEVKEDTRLFDTVLRVDLIRSEKEAITGNEKKEKETPASIRLEFWQSPVNYKGYRFDGRKLVLFGFEPASDFKVKALVTDDLGNMRFFVQNNGEFFEMNDDNGFHPYRKETDKNILQLLK